jgi:hypothetical protein
MQYKLISNINVTFEAKQFVYSLNRNPTTTSQLVRNHLHSTLILINSYRFLCRSVKLVDLVASLSTWSYAIDFVALGSH